MKITICVGTSCHMQGAAEVIERMQDIVASRDFTDVVELSGCVCAGACHSGVCVTVDGEPRSVTPATVDAFMDEILSRESEV